MDKQNANVNINTNGHIAMAIHIPIHIRILRFVSGNLLTLSEEERRSGAIERASYQSGGGFASTLLFTPLRTEA